LISSVDLKSSNSLASVSASITFDAHHFTLVGTLYSPLQWDDQLPVSEWCAMPEMLEYPESAPLELYGQNGSNRIAILA
jgi:hypothetical protein